MSASPVSSAAMGHPFIFCPPSSSHLTAEKKTANKTAEILSHLGAFSQLATVLPASRLEAQPAPEMISSGIPQLDTLTGGFARGCITEICGTASSGRTGILLFALARATQRGEVCALVDASDAFDPASAAAVGMEMSRLLWVRCGENLRRRHFSAGSTGCQQEDVSYRSRPAGAEDQQSGQRPNFSRRKNPEIQRSESSLAQMLKVTDLLLQSNGFGMIALDLGDIPVQSARRIPLASWFRFRRVIEHSPTVLLVLEQQPIAGSCSSALVRVSGAMSQMWGKLSALGSQRSANSPKHLPEPNSELVHSQLLDQLEITAELLRSRLERKAERKPVQSTASFKSRAAWVG